MVRYFASLLLGLSLFSPSLQAHALKVFAAAQGNRVDGSVYYPGGANASGAKVVVRSPQGRILADLRTDAEGRFAFAAGERVDHLIVAETADGHMGAWTVSAAELAGDIPTPVGVAVPSVSEVPGAAAVAPGSPPEGSSLEVLVAKSVARQIRPLRAQIIEHEERVRLRDLLGGIGYIVGVAGVVLWWRSRLERNRV